MISIWLCRNFRQGCKLSQSKNYRSYISNKKNDVERCRGFCNWRILLSIPASYPYLETITKIFLADIGLHSLKLEDIYSRQPIRRPSICLNTNEAFLGSKQLSSFLFRKVNLEQICIYRKRIHVAEYRKNTTTKTSAITCYIRSFLTAQYLPTGYSFQIQMEIMLIKIEERVKELITRTEKKLSRHHKFFSYEC